MPTATGAWRFIVKSWLRRDASMTDYRAEFYGRYEIAVGARQVDQAHYDQCVRQFGGRWGAWLPPDRDFHMLDIGSGTGHVVFSLGFLGTRIIFDLGVGKASMHVRGT